MEGLKATIEAAFERRGEFVDMRPDGRGRVRLDYMVPSRGLIGFRTEFLTATSGSGLLYHTFSHYARQRPGAIAGRTSGASKLT